MERKNTPVKKYPVMFRWLGMVLLIAGIFIVVWSVPGWREKKTAFAPETFNELPSGSGVLVDSNLDTENTVASSTNRLVIEKIGVDSQVFEGGEEALAHGVWHLPRTSTPDKGSNTVLSAHRWLYRPPDPRTFYDLDKVAVGDEIDVDWQGRKYRYRVSDITTVTPDQVGILRPTNTPRLTLFTCTPLFSTSHRLVVVADLIE